MSDGLSETLRGADLPGLPETPHEVSLDRGRVDEVVDRVRGGGSVVLLEPVLDAFVWSAFGGADGEPLDAAGREELLHYYRTKWADVGPLYLAELLSTEFMTEQRARGDIKFSDRLLQLGREEPDLWAEIRQFFRRKEMVMAMLAAAHDPTSSSTADPAADEDEEDLWE